MAIVVLSNNINGGINNHTTMTRLHEVFFFPISRLSVAGTSHLSPIVDEDPER